MKRRKESCCSGGDDTAAAAALSDERKVHKMRFRPCIDIHNGKVKQIVGGSLRDEGDYAQTNFASELDARAYAEMYKRDGLSGGHIILLNPAGSPYYEETRRQAFAALRAYPGGLQIGGGITPENAAEYLEAGASHVIVTSYVFGDGRFHPDRLEKLVRETGKEKDRRRPSDLGGAHLDDNRHNRAARIYVPVRRAAHVCGALRVCGAFIYAHAYI